MKNLNKKMLLIVSIFSGLTTFIAENNHSWDKSPFFNTKFLRNYNLVEDVLVNQIGFEQIQFKSTDGLTLEGLLLKQPNAIGTIIFCAGFWPGRKEGQAPIFRMLPPNYNILCFDARGHAKSEGKFWSNLSQYGKNEYKDVLGAIEYVKNKIGGKVVIYGVCAGAFHTSHALLKLSKEKKMKETNIVGFIFDSGFESATSVSSALKYHIEEKWAPNLLSWYADRKTIKTTYLYQITSCIMSSILTTLRDLILMPSVRKIEPETRLSDKIQNITCPIYFIHAKNDNYAPFDQIEQLSQLIEEKVCWWIEKSSHATHALKYKHEYRKRLLNFLDSVVQKV